MIPVTERLRASLSRHLMMTADRSALRMEARAVKDAPKGASSPGLKNEIHGRAEQAGDIIKARLECTAPHGAYIEFGTGPAAGHARYMPPPGALRQWIERKLGIGGDDLDAVENAIRWKIYMKGTKSQPFMKPALDAGKKRWKPDLAAAARAAIREVARGR